MPYFHVPVMLGEVIDYLNLRPGKIYVDCTVGGAGHSRAICNGIKPGGILIGVDQDDTAIKNAKKVIKKEDFTLHLFHSNFARLPEILEKINISAVDGILLDLGTSLHQLKASGRGFTFEKDEPLDMRMNTESGVTAEELINESSKADLEDIFKNFGEERWYRRIAQRIVKSRKINRITSSGQLSKIVCSAVPQKAFGKRIHPATKIFMSLRIAVNKELERLEEFLGFVVDLLNPGGRLCALSFHSLEDRIVKHTFKMLAKDCICPPKIPLCVCNNKRTVKVLTRKALCPMDEETRNNPRARSVKLRVIEKLRG